MLLLLIKGFRGLDPILLPHTFRDRVYATNFVKSRNSCLVRKNQITKIQNEYYKYSCHKQFEFTVIDFVQKLNTVFHFLHSVKIFAFNIFFDAGHSFWLTKTLFRYRLIVPLTSNTNVKPILVLKCLD